MESIDTIDSILLRIKGLGCTTATVAGSGLGQLVLAQNIVGELVGQLASDSSPGILGAAAIVTFRSLGAVSITGSITVGNIVGVTMSLLASYIRYGILGLAAMVTQGGLGAVGLAGSIAVGNIVGVAMGQLCAFVGHSVYLLANRAGRALGAIGEAGGIVVRGITGVIFTLCYEDDLIDVVHSASGIISLDRQIHIHSASTKNTTLSKHLIDCCGVLIATIEHVEIFVIKSIGMVTSVIVDNLIQVIFTVCNQTIYHEFTHSTGSETKENTLMACKAHYRCIILSNCNLKRIFGRIQFHACRQSKCVVFQENL